MLPFADYRAVCRSSLRWRRRSSSLSAAGGGRQDHGRLPRRPRLRRPGTRRLPRPSPLLALGQVWRAPRRARQEPRTVPGARHTKWEQPEPNAWFPRICARASPADPAASRPAQIVRRAVAPKRAASACERQASAKPFSRYCRAQAPAGDDRAHTACREDRGHDVVVQPLDLVRRQVLDIHLYLMMETAPALTDGAGCGWLGDTARPAVGRPSRRAPRVTSGDAVADPLVDFPAARSQCVARRVALQRGTFRYYGGH